MTRFTDKTRGIKANVEYRVQEASTDGIIARASDGKHWPSTQQSQRWPLGLRLH